MTVVVEAPQTSADSAYQARHADALSTYARALRMHAEVLRVAVGLHAHPSDSTLRVLVGRIETGTQYNTARTDFEQRAATVLSNQLLRAVRALARDGELFRDSEVQRFGLDLRWTARNFVSDGGTEDESVAVYFDRADAQALLDFGVTSQEFLDRSLILGMQGYTDLGRISVDAGRIL